MTTINHPTQDRVESKWRVARRRTGTAMLGLAYLSSVVGFLAVFTVGSALMVLGLLFLGVSLALHSTKRRLILSTPVFALGMLGLIIIVQANV